MRKLRVRMANNSPVVGSVAAMCQVLLILKPLISVTVLCGQGLFLWGWKDAKRTWNSTSYSMAYLGGKLKVLGAGSSLGSASVSAWGWWELQVVSEEKEAASPVMQLSLDHGGRRKPVVLGNIRPVGSPPPLYALLPNAPMSPLKSFFPCNWNSPRPQLPSQFPKVLLYLLVFPEGIVPLKPSGTSPDNFSAYSQVPWAQQGCCLSFLPTFYFQAIIYLALSNSLPPLRFILFSSTYPPVGCCLPPWVKNDEAT